MPTSTITPHPTRTSSRVPKPPTRLGDSPPYSPAKKKSVPTDIFISSSPSTPSRTNISPTFIDDIVAESNRPTTLQEDVREYSLHQSEEEISDDSSEVDSSLVQSDAKSTSNIDRHTSSDYTKRELYDR